MLRNLWQAMSEIFEFWRLVLCISTIVVIAMLPVLILFGFAMYIVWVVL